MTLPANLPQTMELIQYKRGQWYWDAPAGHTLEDVCNKDYWVHVLQSRTIESRDTIRVVAIDNSFCVDLFVTQVDENRMWAKTRMMAKYWEDAPAQEELPEQYNVKWAGPSDRWRIIAPGGGVVEKGFATRDEAEDWLAEYKQQRAA